MSDSGFKDNNKLNYKKVMAYILGLTSTMPIVGIPMGSKDVSFYRILFAIAIIYCGIKTSRFRVIVGGESKRLLLWLAEGVFACLCGWMFLSQSAPEWSAAAGSYVMRVVSLFLFVLFWCSSKDSKELNQYVAKGFFLGCLINCVWASIDAIGYYLFGTSINNTIFSGYIARHGIRYNMLSLIYSSSGMIRAGGFNSDPAQLGFLAPIIVCYATIKKKYWLLGIAVAAILASASTTALVTSVIVLIANIGRNNKKKGLTLKGLIILFLGGVVVLSLILIYWSQITQVFFSAYTRFADRLGNVYLNDSSDNIRYDYIRFMPLAILQVIPFMFFGSGFGTASLGYVKNPVILQSIGSGHYFPYDMENTYVSYLFDTGFVGITLFIIILRTIYKKYKNKIRHDELDDFTIIIWSFICSSIISLFFYHYVLFGPQMLLFTVALSNMDLEDTNS